MISQGQGGRKPEEADRRGGAQGKGEGADFVRVSLTAAPEAGI